MPASSSPVRHGEAVYRSGRCKTTGDPGGTITSRHTSNSLSSPCLYLFLCTSTDKTISGEYQSVFDAIEMSTVGIFTIEYLLRLYAVGEEPQYAGVIGMLVRSCLFLGCML